MDLECWLFQFACVLIYIQCFLYFSFVHCSVSTENATPSFREYKGTCRNIKVTYGSEKEKKKIRVVLYLNESGYNGFYKGDFWIVLLMPLLLGTRRSTVIVTINPEFEFTFGIY